MSAWRSELGINLELDVVVAIGVGLPADELRGGGLAGTYRVGGAGQCSDGLAAEGLLRYLAVELIDGEGTLLAVAVVQSPYDLVAELGARVALIDR